MTPAATCSSCGAETPAGARFCPACGASQAPASPMATERKVVTTLFADIVGFTALSERIDPEDVDAALRGYFDMARTTIERFGGVVEKYIGDAVAGVFGVPIAHEDDAERAVRAALAIVDGVRSLPPIGEHELRVRVGVNTGRALARLSVNPGSGEGILVGDAVNTAARLLAAAPPMSVVVGDLTHSLSARLIEYEELAPFAVKGKTEEVKAWIAHGTIARRGVDFDRSPATTMIGREVELGVLKGLFEKACASSTPQYALIVGEAGIGKSRLVHEFGAALDRRPGLMCTWRQGSCPPYGENLAFWALGEIVRAHAGILLVDPPAVVEEKLARALGAERDSWLESRLRPLVGLSAQQSDRGENFAAWLQFFLTMAARRPTILVFEDLHWASEPTLAFLGYLLAHAGGAPLLVLGTARPEFVDTHPGVAGLAGDLTTIDLKCLSPAEASRLASSVPAAAGLPGLAELVADRSGGNPFFAEELVRYLVEHPPAGQDADPGSPTAGAGGEVPDSVLSLIAARLDALPADQKALLADAAVVGPLFWPGAVSVLSGADESVVESALEKLSEREFVRRMTAPTFMRGSEYSFWHALTRDVAYEQVPRAARISKHSAVADWMEAAGGMAKEIPDVLAYHRWTALELAQTAGRNDVVAALRQPTVDALALAGDRALALDLEAARRDFARALGLLPPDGVQRPALLAHWAHALARSGSLNAAVDTFREAISGLQAQGDRRAAALAMTELARVMVELDDPRAVEESEAALQTLEGEGVCEELARALEFRAYLYEVAGDNSAALRAATRTLDIDRELGLPESARALMRRGIARCAAGDAKSSLRDLEQAVSAASGSDAAESVAAAYACLAEATLALKGPRESLAVDRAGHAAAHSRHDRTGEGILKCAMVEDLFFLGRWDEALALRDELKGWLVDHNQVLGLLGLSNMSAAVFGLRGGDLAQAAVREFEENELFEQGRSTFPTGALAYEAAGDVPGALRCLEALAASPTSVGANPSLILWWLMGLRVGLRIGSRRLIADLARAARAATSIQPLCATIVSALLSEHEADFAAATDLFAQAAAGWHDLEVPLEEAEARFGLGRCLAAAGDEQEADGQLSSACEIFYALGMRPAVAAIDAALNRSASSRGGNTRLR